MQKHDFAECKSCLLASHKDLSFKPRLHVEHFYLHRHFTCTRLSDVAGIVKTEGVRVAWEKLCNKIAGTMLQNIHRTEPFRNILQTLDFTGYTCNCPRLWSQNIFEDVKLPLRAENHRCSSHCFKLWSSHCFKLWRHLRFLLALATRHSPNCSMTKV